MKVNIIELQQMISLLVDSFKRANGNEVELNNDFYWSISSDEIYNAYEAPKDMTLGQLTDDWETLKNASKSDSLVPYDLQRIANILKALSIEHPI